MVLGATLLAACAGPTPTKAPVKPSPTSGVAAIQTPAVPLTVVGVATMTQGRCQCSTLHLTAIAGDQLGSVTLGASVVAPVAAGPQGLYYVLGDQLLRLGADGSATQVGTVASAPGGAGVSLIPDPELGSLAVAPGGQEWAYFQSSSAQGVETEQVWLGGVNRTPRVLVSTVLGPAPASAEFPNGWSYQLLGWAQGYLVVAQVAQGSDAFGGSALELSRVNPQTGADTVLSNSQTCPIGAIAANGTYLCFQQGGGQATELITGSEGLATAAWPLPPGSGYGAAAFDPSGHEVLFSSCPGCGAAPSAAYLGSQMEILNTDTGAIQILGPPGLVSDAWLPGGQVVATQYSEPLYGRRGAAPTSEVVLVDLSSGATTPITSDPTSQFVGIATG